MAGSRPLGRFMSSLYGSPPSAHETEDERAARWVAATEPCSTCGRWLEAGDPYTCEQDSETGGWRTFCADCLRP